MKSSPLLILLVIVMLLAGCGGRTTLAVSATSAVVEDQSPTPSSLLDNPAPPTSVPIAPIATPTPTAPAVTPTPSGPLTVHGIDVGQGDAILIRTAEGKNALIDGGPEGSGVLDYLQGQGVEGLALVIATHPHPDHVGGLPAVFKALPVSTFVSGAGPVAVLGQFLLDTSDIATAEFREVQRGDTISLGSLTLDVLHPAGKASMDVNNQSIVLRLRYGKATFLFTGDAGKVAEEDMLAAGLDLRAQILKVGHHGSSDASSEAFLQAVKPEVAIYSASGYGWDYPNAETLSAIAATAAKVYGTNTDGTVVVTTDGSTYTVTTTRGGSESTFD